MLKLEMLPAGHGDCLWIEYGDPLSPHRSSLAESFLAGVPQPAFLSRRSCRRSGKGDSMKRSLLLLAVFLSVLSTVGVVSSRSAEAGQFFYAPTTSVPLRRPVTLETVVEIEDGASAYTVPTGKNLVLTGFLRRDDGGTNPGLLQVTKNGSDWFSVRFYGTGDAFGYFEPITLPYGLFAEEQDQIALEQDSNGAFFLLGFLP